MEWDFFSFELTVTCLLLCYPNYQKRSILFPKFKFEINWQLNQEENIAAFFHSGFENRSRIHLNSFFICIARVIF